MTQHTYANAIELRAGHTPSAWINRWSALIAAGATVLDFASGSGRNLPPLLALGARVTAIDRDAQALAGLPDGVERIVADLEGAPWPFAPEGSDTRRFDAVVCCNYLFRPRLARLFDLVAPGGLLLYETFAQGNERYGRPSNPDFLLRPGELLAAAQQAGFEVLAYEAGFSGPARPARVQRLCAAHPEHAPERYPLVG